MTLQKSNDCCNYELTSDYYTKVVKCINVELNPMLVCQVQEWHLYDEVNSKVMEAG